MAIAVTVERTQGQGGTEAAPIAKQVLESCWGAMTEVADNTLVDGRYKVRRPDRLRRDGRRLPGRGHPPGARGGAEDAAPPLRPGRRVRGAVPPRGQGRRGPAAPATWWASTTAASTRAPTTSRWSTCRGRTLKDIVTAEAPLDQLRVIDLGTQILQAAGFAPQARRDPPRLQAPQRDRRRRRVRKGHRLRHRPRGRVRDDRDGVDHGHRAVPLARAGAGPRRDRGVGPLLDRRDALRDAHRPAAVRGRQRRVRSRSSTSRSRRRRCRRAA